jgi:ubiquinone/menaquinone biosynthesis C-methylase UbiE
MANCSIPPSAWSVKGSCFGDLSDAYAATRGGRPPSLLKKLSEYIQDGPVTDAGAGTGISAREIANLNPNLKVVGVDHDLKMIEKARAAEEDAPEVRSSSRKSISYLHGKAEQLPIADKTQSMVTAMSCFHWFNKDLALQEFSRVLKPKGHVAIVTGVYNSFSKMNNVLVDVVGHPIDHPDMGEEDNDLFERHGFDVVFKGTFRQLEKGTIDWAVGRITSTSRWDDVKAASKETEAKARLFEEFTKLADSDGTITRESEQLLTIVQKR